MPAVLESPKRFGQSAITRVIRFGLDAVDGVGEDVARSIAAGAPYSSMIDFLERNSTAGRTAVTALIAAGAFDSLHGQDSRAVLIAALPAVMPVVAAGRQLAALGQPNPLRGFHVDLGGHSQPSLERLVAEHAVLGLYVSGHPRDLYDDQDALGIDVVDPTYEGKKIRVVGIISSIDRKVSKRGDPYAVMILADQAASIEVLWFERFLGGLFGTAPGEVVGVVGRVGVRDDRTSIIGYEIERLKLRGPEPIVIRTDAENLDLDAIARERSRLNGDRPVHLELGYRGRIIVVRLP